MIGTLALGALVVSTSAEAAQQLSADDEIRLAAFRYLLGTLMPIDSTVRHFSCVEVHAITEYETTPSPGDDPSPALLGRLAELGPRIVPRSECELPGPVVGSPNPAVIVERPVVYSVGRPARSGGRVRIAVAYYVHGTNGGGWHCTAGRSRGAWRIVDCLPAWIS